VWVGLTEGCINTKVDGRVTVIEYKQLCEKLEAGEHFALARFNDGEMMAVQSAEGVIARGDQPIVGSLADCLRLALERLPTDAFYIGQPCSLCFPSLRRLYDKYVSDSQPNQTQATILINNGRWLKSFEAICRAAENRPVYWVGQPEHDLHCLERWGVSPVKYEDPTVDAWSRRKEGEKMLLSRTTVWYY